MYICKYLDIFIHVYMDIIWMYVYMYTDLTTYIYIVEIRNAPLILFSLFVTGSWKTSWLATGSKCVHSSFQWMWPC